MLQENPSMIEKRKWLPSDLEMYAHNEGLDPFILAQNISGIVDYNQSDDFLRFAGQVYTYPVRTPEQWAQKAPTLYKDMLTIMDRKTLEMFFPGVTSGVYLVNRYQEDPTQFIPSPEMINSILFAGYESIETLQEGVKEKLLTFLDDTAVFEEMNGVDPQMG